MSGKEKGAVMWCHEMDDRKQEKERCGKGREVQKVWYKLGMPMRNPVDNFAHAFGKTLRDTQKCHRIHKLRIVVSDMT